MTEGISFEATGRCRLSANHHDRMWIRSLRPHAAWVSTFAGVDRTQNEWGGRENPVYCHQEYGNYEITQARFSCENRACRFASSSGSKGIRGTRQWPSVDSPSTAVRRCHLAGVYCRNPLDHLPFLIVHPLRLVSQYQSLHGFRVPSRTFPRPTKQFFPRDRVSTSPIFALSAIFREFSS